MIIVLDAGHGGRDPGAIGHGLNEKDIALTLGLRLGAILTKRHGADVSVLYTRDDDTFVELSDRARFANANGADYYVSIHVNSSAGPTEGGFETFVFTRPDSADIAYQNVIHNAVAPLYRKQGRPDRGTKQANLAVLRETRCPAILLEYGFINNAADAALLKSDAWLDDLARATADGIAAAFGLKIAEEVGADMSADKRPLELADWQWAMLADALDGLYRKSTSGEIPPVITDYTWAERASKAELTADEVAWLSVIMLARSI